MKVANILIAALIIVAYLVMIVICIIQGGKIEAIRKAYDDLSVRLKPDIVAEVIDDIKPDIIDKITDINTALCWKGWEDYGREMLDSCGYQIPEHIIDFIDLERYGKYCGEEYLQEYSNGLIEIQ